MMVTRPTLICNCILLTMLLVLAACPGNETSGESAGDVSGLGVVSNEEAKSAVSPADVNSLFIGTGYDKYEPLAIDIPHGLDRVFVKKLGPEGLPTLVESFGLGDGLGDRTEYVSSSELLAAFVKGHPYKDECLLVSHRQDSPDEPIRDVLWKANGRSKVELDYLGVPGIPGELPVLTTYNTESLYSWDGNQVVVLLNHGGLCVLDQVTGKQQYIEYLPLPGEPTGRQCQAAPSPDGRSYLVLSRWYIGRAGDWCQVALLDLVSGEWLRSFEILDPENPARQWVIYEIAGADLAEGPWLVRGSRAPNINTEHKRVPRLALLDPDTGHVDLLMFHGDPYWPLALDPGGRYVVYLDQQRQGIVRLDLEESKLEIDPRWYGDKATLLVGDGGSPVYIWSEKLLFKADFTENEDLPKE